MVAEKQDLPVSAFDDILEQLVVAGYVGKSIDNIQGVELMPDKQFPLTSTAQRD